MSIRAVMDTNLLISAVIGSPAAPPRLIYEALKAERFTSVTSLNIIEEIEDVFSRIPVRAQFKLSDADVKQFLADFIRVSAIVSTDRYVNPIQTPDPKDDMFVTCGLQGDADYIISGDKKHLLTLKEVEGIKIISAREFLSLLEE